MFQFPTNGKAHSDALRLQDAEIKRRRVSIPYEREGTFRPGTANERKPNGWSFNSLRTGRHIQTRIFYSLYFHLIPVSIPYEREGTFRRKEDSESNCRRDVREFQFPTNGKAHSDKQGRWNAATRPECWFQFPTNGKAHSDRLGTFHRRLQWFRFQFPTNGKAHSDSRFRQSGLTKRNVSIPYEREGTFRH